MVAVAAAAGVVLVLLVPTVTGVAVVGELTFVGFFSPPPANVDMTVHSRPLPWVPAARTFVVTSASFLPVGLVSFSAGMSGCLLGLTSVGDL